MNYAIVSLETWRIVSREMTLSDAKNEIENAAPFGIINLTTKNMVVYRLVRGFTPTRNQIEKLPKHSKKLANLNHRFNHHPRQ